MKYKEKFNNLIKQIEQKKHMNTNMIKKAFKFAENMHKGQNRKSGEPYISHPVSVAYIIANLGFDDNMISAALLHDVIEDCGCTILQLKREFNTKVANLVDSVTAIKTYVGQGEEFKKFLLQEKTYNKLYSFAMSEKLAFYIKFADRLHNLSTISVFPRYKQIEKVKETQKWLTPVLISIRANGLYYDLENHCYKILEKKEYELYSEYYNKFLYNHSGYLSKLEKNFNKHLSRISKQIGKFLEVDFRQINMYELKQNQGNIFNLREKKVDQFIFSKAITHKIFIVVKNSKLKSTPHQNLIKIFKSFYWFQDFKVLGFLPDKKFKNQEGLIIQGPLGLKFLVYLFTPKERFEYINGKVKGIEVPYDESINQFEISENYIKVLTNKNEEIIMPEKSTVLDFAFKIHNDFGFSCTGAYINDSPTKMPLYTILNNRDKVDLVIERDENQSCIDMSQIKWLSYVNTDSAKKKLIKHFESMYEKFNNKG
ncbi:MAG: HD domain-containing protein [Candidatus Woesearchaeota archaeon]